MSGEQQCFERHNNPTFLTPNPWSQGLPSPNTWEYLLLAVTSYTIYELLECPNCYMVDRQCHGGLAEVTWPFHDSHGRSQMKPVKGPVPYSLSSPSWLRSLYMHLASWKTIVHGWYKHMVVIFILPLFEFRLQFLWLPYRARPYFGLWS